GRGKAGQGEGQHSLEVDLSLDELAEILGEELALPRIQSKGKKNLTTPKVKYTGVHTTGPESLRHFKRTYKQALKRSIASGTYNAKMPVIVPTREDRRYRSWRLTELPQSNAVVIYMMDVSGSMGDEQKEIVRIESFWIDTWLSANYKGLETRYIIHDAVAREVDRETFFHTRESGGTMISSAYKLSKEMMDADYDTGSWNIYPFHFSDGDNWSADDTRTCVNLLKSEILTKVNQFAYGQVESPYGSGQFIKDLREAFDSVENVALSEISNKDAIYNSIKEFLGKGYEYGLSKIYEMVINNNPSYAYLLESNMDVDQKLVMAHVFGHVDFFKNNFSFRHTNRKMMDEMANHATRVRRIIDKVGLEPVETFVDRSLSLENLIDQHSQHFQRRAKDKDEEDKPIEVRGFKADREYMQGFINPREFLDEQRKKLEDERAAKKKFPERPQRDVLQFLLEHAPLERWEGEILSLMREEAYYFAPQGQTKICNEGWASFCHSKILTEKALKD